MPLSIDEIPVVMNCCVGLLDFSLRDVAEL